MIKLPEGWEFLMVTEKELEELKEKDRKGEIELTIYGVYIDEYSVIVRKIREK